MIQDTARRFAQTEILPNVKQWEKTGTPRDLLRKMGQAGLMGICIDPEWGGAGADFVSYVVAMEEISAADGGIANMIGPMIGAAIFIWLSDTLSVMWARWPLLLGLIFMAVILFFQGGMLQVGASAKSHLLGLRAKWVAARAEAGD